MTDFVLIHGTTQDPSGWERLVRSLESLGHRAVTVDLAGDDERSPADYAEAVAAQVPAGITEQIVVAHSGSGQVLPATARRLRARPPGVAGRLRSRRRAQPPRRRLQSAGRGVQP